MKQVLSEKDLSSFHQDDVPVWAYHVTTQQMLWANDAALKFWHAETEQEFLRRDFSTDSRAVRERLSQMINEAQKGGWFRGSWTLFPKDIPTTVVLESRSFEVNGTQDGLIFRIVGQLDYAADDPDGLRMLVLARTTSVCVSLFDMSGHLISENPAALALRQSFVDWNDDAKNLKTRYHSADIALRIVGAASQDSVETFEFILKSAEADQVLSVTAKRIRDPVTGDPVVHITEEDVTEKVELANTLAGFNKELEQRVAERTLELKRVNERLRQSQKLEVLGKLTGGIAHDFNNLLAVIQGNAELMQMMQSYQEDLLSEIKTATTRGADLTKALLAYARKQPLHAGPVDLRQVLNSTQNILQRTLGEDIKLSMSAAPDLWLANVDQGQIKDAVMNLALNARDAMIGGGHLKIEMANIQMDHKTSPDQQMDLSGDFIELTVSDTGIGMSPEVASKATDPFFTTKPVGQGSGLGLSMVYGFSRQSGGNMTIESSPSAGTKIKLLLPRYVGVARLPTDHAIKPDVPKSKGEHIVIVEDDPAVCRFLVRSLELLGYRIHNFPSARPALEFLKGSNTTDLLLTDVILPDGMSGPDLASCIRKEKSDLKILFLSGYPERPTSGRHEFEAGTVLLNKPISFDELGSAVRRMLDA